VSIEAMERLTKNFYDWELIGRGWREYPHLVPIEPAYRPFPGHEVVLRALADDGRKPTFLSSLFERARGAEI